MTRIGDGGAWERYLLSADAARAPRWQLRVLASIQWARPPKTGTYRALRAALGTVEVGSDRPLPIPPDSRRDTAA